jgi:hypothetical protein
MLNICKSLNLTTLNYRKIEILYKTKLFFIKKFKFHKFVTRVIKMINFITIINIDTPTWPLPTNTNVPKHTQNSYQEWEINNSTSFMYR